MHTQLTCIQIAGWILLTLLCLSGGVLWDCGDASKDRSHSGLTEQGGGLI